MSPDEETEDGPMGRLSVSEFLSGEDKEDMYGDNMGWHMPGRELILGSHMPGEDFLAGCHMAGRDLVVGDMPGRDLVVAVICQVGT